MQSHGNVNTDLSMFFPKYTSFYRSVCSSRNQDMKEIHTTAVLHLTGEAMTDYYGIFLPSSLFQTKD